MCQTAFVNSSHKMIVRKYLTFAFTFLSILLKVLATKTNIEENKKNIKNATHQFLNNTKPLRYQVYLDPCINDGNFSGYVQIDLLILKPTKCISLHSQELEFCEEGVFLTPKGSLADTFKALKSRENVENSSLEDSDELMDNSSGTIKPCEFIYDKKEQTVTMKFEEILKPARYSLEINYIGSINSFTIGVYRKFYKDLDNQKRAILLTNFFPISARRIFPCRDEPAIKAEIYFTIQTSLNFTTITANSPQNYIEYKEGQRWTHFYPIKNISTYQLNFAVLSNVQNVTKISSNKTFITYTTTTADLKSTNLTRDIHEKAMTMMENYTQVTYPLNAFINLILPEKLGATLSSSLGFIITKKDDILYNKRFSPHKKIDIVLRASQDIINQWFNHIISPACWKYMWLTEGVAEYMKFYISDKIMPHLRLKDIFIIRELQRRSFLPNKITDSSPLNKYIPDNPKNIQYLLIRSIATNSKSASIIRMMSNFLSEKIFDSGIMTFLKMNKFKSVKPDDFWESIQSAVNASKDNRLINVSVKKIMKTWTNSELYPIVNVTRNYTTGFIKLTQIPATKFFGLKEKNFTNKWYIPINFATQSNCNFNTTFPTHWLKPDSKRLIINGIDPKDWVIFNIRQTGYYRVLYDEENWNRLAGILNSDNYYKIPPINRAQIINDAVQFSLQKELDVRIFLNLLSYLRREIDYIPWYDAQFIFSFFNYHLSNTLAYDSLKKFCLQLIAPVADKLGYEDRVDDDFSTLLLRRISNYWTCHFGYKSCWNNATKQLEAYLCNRKSKLGTVDLQEWAHCFGLNGADETIWNKMFQKYQENLNEDSLIYLACSENMTILHNFLNLSILNNSIIPKKQVLSVFKSVCLYQSGDDKRINLCLNFINNRFDEIKLRLGNSTEAFTYLLDLLVSEIRQKEQLQQFKKILTQERSPLILAKLNARVRQIQNRITIFDQKANYYQPFLKEKISNI